MGVSRGLTNSPLDCWFWHISGLRAAALRRLASETRLRAQCGAVALFAPSAPEIRKHPRPKPRALFYAGDGGRTHTVSPPTDFESAQVRRTWWIFWEFQGTYFLPFFSEKAPIHDTIFDFRTYLRLEIWQTNVVEKSFSLCGQSFKNGRQKNNAFGK